MFWAFPCQALDDVPDIVIDPLCPDVVTVGAALIWTGKVNPW